jgi:hypothetical protein
MLHDSVLLYLCSRIPECNVAVDDWCCVISCRVAAFLGNNLVAEDHRECRGGERVLR